MTKRTKKVGVTGKYGTRTQHKANLLMRPLFIATTTIPCGNRSTARRNLNSKLGTDAHIHLGLCRYVENDHLQIDDTRLIAWNKSNMEDDIYPRQVANSLRTATVLPCVSRSRRWKSASTPSTPALSAARSPSAASPPVSGTAAPASAPWPVVLTLLPLLLLPLCARLCVV